MRLKRILIGAACLAAWYAYSGNPANFYTPSSPRSEKRLEERVGSQYRLPDVIQTTTGPVTVKDIDFNGSFLLETPRYRLHKSEDFPWSRAIGYVASIPTKIFFWDSNASYGLDAERTKRVLAILENDKSLSGLTVRVNHTRAWYDTWRLFTEEKVTERNNWLARMFLGVPVTLLSGITSEFSRSDHYNPLTQTTIVYSNIDAIPFHEIGHHKDYQRFTSDWAYALMNTIFPPIKLYKEYQASMYAKDYLPPEQQYQFYRYLIPAYLTYLWAMWGLGKKFYRKYLRQKDSLLKEDDD